MSIIKADTLQDRNGNPLVSVADGVASGSFAPVGMRNRIINGDMTIDQRNAGASVTPINGAYALDRWKQYQSVASKYSVQQNAGGAAPPAGFANYLGVVSLSSYALSSADYFTLEQTIEGYNVADLGWGTADAQTVTLSFWVRSSLTGTFGGSIKNKSAGADRSYPFSFVISVANTWERKTITVIGDTTGTWLNTNGVGITLSINLGTGATFSGTAGAWSANNYLSATGAVSVVGTSGATLYITGVQLEAGSVATPFERRQYGQELALCQRYFQTYSNPPLRGVVQSPTAAYRCGMLLPVLMRASPTATVGALDVYDGAAITTVSSVNVAYLNTKSIEFSVNLSASLTTGRPAVVYQNGSTNNLSLSAEM